MQLKFMMKKRHEEHEHEASEHEYHEKQGNHIHSEDETKKMCPGLKRVKDVLADPPSTWAQYVGKADDHWLILEMETAELERAHAGLKAGTSTPRDVMRELGHVAAACICAFNALSEK